MLLQWRACEESNARLFRGPNLKTLASLVDMLQAAVSRIVFTAKLGVRVSNVDRGKRQVAAVGSFQRKIK